MRWLLKELVERTTNAATNAATLVPPTTASVVQTAGPLSGGGRLVGAVTDAATSIVSSASDAASVLATDLGSTVAASVVEATAKVGGGVKSAAAMPTRLGVASSGTAAVGGEGISLSGRGSAELAKHLDGADSMWHGHGRILCVLVVVHLAALLYWCETGIYVLFCCTRSRLCYTQNCWSLFLIPFNGVRTFDGLILFTRKTQSAVMCNFAEDDCSSDMLNNIFPVRNWCE